MGRLTMKKLLYALLCAAIGSIALQSCKSDDIELSPSVPYRIEINGTEFQNGDSLYGRIIILTDSLIPGTAIKKIDCRLGNIVIGTVKNEMVCPFGVRLIDKPIGTHTFSVIIKCEAPDCDETFWRYDFETITIKK